MTTRKHVFYCVLALVSLLGLGIIQSARADLITNGGFETGFSDWTLSGDTSIFTHFVTGTFLGISPHSGSRQAVLGPSSNHGFLTQNLSTTLGASYVLDFWVANNNNGQTANNFFAVSWDGGPNLTSLTNAPNAGYTEYMFNVTASTTTTVLQFEFFHGFASGAFLLDGVSVEPAGVGVPDGGSTLSLLSFASLGLVALRRKLRC